MSELSSTPDICASSPSSHQQQSVNVGADDCLHALKCEMAARAGAAVAAAVAAAIQAEASVLPNANGGPSKNTEEPVTAAPCATVLPSKASSSRDSTRDNADGSSSSSSSGVVAAAEANSGLYEAAAELRVSLAVITAATRYVVIANKLRTGVPRLLSICSGHCKIVHSFVVSQQQEQQQEQQQQQQQQDDVVTVWVHFASLLGAAHVAQGNKYSITVNVLKLFPILLTAIPIGSELARFASASSIYVQPCKGAEFHAHFVRLNCVHIPNTQACWTPDTS
jgi:hypothetical protein